MLDYEGQTCNSLCHRGLEMGNRVFLKVGECFHSIGRRDEEGTDFMLCADA